MLIEIHIIQNHSPANLNRDDLGAPKTCFFGGVIRSRISSQCLKRSIRMSNEFSSLTGGIRTRRLAELIAKEIGGESAKERDRVTKILAKCGIKTNITKNKKEKENDSNNENEEGNNSSQDSKMIVFTTREAIHQMADFYKNNQGKTDVELAAEFAKIIAEKTYVPDMALSGRMLEASGEKEIWKSLNTKVEAALQAAHAISTHESHPEVDYFIAADDIPGSDSGAAYLDEAMFVSACYYKYFSINWEQLLKNLDGNKALALHTVGAFIEAAAKSNPSGKQNSYASNSLPDGILIELKSSPVSYANAFSEPVSRNNGRGLVEQSIAQLAKYVSDIHVGYGKPIASLWFSPNLRNNISADEDTYIKNTGSLDDLLTQSIDTLSKAGKLDLNWEKSKETVLSEIEQLNALVLK